MLFVFFGIGRFVKIGMYGIMRHYSYLTLKNKTSPIRYVYSHCAILDNDTMLCYHLSSDGYSCESCHDMLERYELVERVDFVSDKDIDLFMRDYATRYREYSVLHNNCEMFCNCFYGGELVKQNRFYNVVCVVILAMIGFALLKR